MEFLKEILNDIEWRMGEIATLKTLPRRYRMQTHHQLVLIRFAVPSYYSLWEGFVKNAFELYIRELNSLELNVHDCCINLITHALTSFDKLKLENPRMNFDSKRQFVEFYQQAVAKKLHIVSGLPTRSNIDYEVTNEIFGRFNLNPLQKEFEMPLKKFLRFRNSIAHGEYSIPITNDDLNEFSLLINRLMEETFIRIEEGFVNKSYRRT